MFKKGDKVEYIQHTIDSDEKYFETGLVYTITDLQSLTSDPQIYLDDKLAWVDKTQVKLVESNTIKENPSSITLKPSYELYIQGQTFSLSKSEFEQLKEQVNE